jgi:putative tricarboxylic transport membrane protein
MDKNENAPAGGISTRWAELVVALVIVAIGIVVVVDSHRVGIGWGDDGPRAGYFPNIIGWILTVAGGWIAGETVFRWKSLAGGVFVSRARSLPVLAMLLPTIVYVALVAMIGIYVASAIYIATFMRWQGKYRWSITALVSLAVPTAIFLLFELWFLIPLPKGPIERLLGF